MVRDQLIKFVFVFLALQILLFAGVSQATDLTQYDLEASLDVRNHILSGTVNARFVNTAQVPVDSIYFILLPNTLSQKNPFISDRSNEAGYLEGFDPAWMHVDGVVAPDGSPLPFEYEKAPETLQRYSLERVLLRVQLPAILKPGEITEVTMDFRTKFPRAVWVDGCFDGEVYRWRFGAHPFIAPMDAHGWNFEKYYLPRGLYKYSVEVPEGFQMFVGSRKPVHRRRGEGTNVFYTTEHAISGGVPIFVSDHLENDTVDADGIRVEIAFGRQHRHVAARVGEYAKDILEYYDAQYGPLPYRQIVISENNVDGHNGTAAEGMVMIGNVVLKSGELLLGSINDRILERVLAHEIAHLYFGIGVVVDFDRDNWLSEGFANYLSYAYIRDQYGEARSFYDWKENPWDAGLYYYLFGERTNRKGAEDAYWRTRRDGWDEPLVLSTRDTRHAQTRFARQYLKGYLVIRAMAAHVGTEKFHAALRSIITQYQVNHMTSEQFIHEVEKITGADLALFSEGWLHTNDFVDYGIQNLRTTSSHDGWETTVDVQKKGEAPARVKLLFSTDEGKTVEQTISDTGSYLIKSERPVVSASIDPGHLYPDAYRFDNYYPRKNHIAFSMRDLPSDARAWLFYFDPLNRFGPGMGGGYYQKYFWRFSASVFDGQVYPNAYYVHLLSRDRLFVAGLTRSLQWNTMNGSAFFIVPIYRNVDFGSASMSQFPVEVVTIGLERTTADWGGRFLRGRVDWIHNETPWNDSYYGFGLSYAPNIRENHYDTLRLNGFWGKYYRIAPNWDLQTRIIGRGGFSSRPGQNVWYLSDMRVYPYDTASGNTQATLGFDLTYPLYRYGEIRYFNFFYIRQIDFHAFNTNAVLWNPGARFFSEAGIQLDFHVVATSLLPPIVYNIGIANSILAPSSSSGTSPQFFWRVGVSTRF